METRPLPSCRKPPEAASDVVVKLRIVPFVVPAELEAAARK
jgi:hypothetical protein